MSQQKTFTHSDLTAALSAVGLKVHRKLRAYLIGGCAMTFMGRKSATKDIDVVFVSGNDTKDFTSVMRQVGFAYVSSPPAEYDALGAWAILENKDGMRFDVFNRRVCRALELSKTMLSRAVLYQTFGKLHVHLMTPEDIFLFKGITEREADLDDMRILAEAGLRWPVIEKECLSQKPSGKWAHILATKLLDLKRTFGINSPIIRPLMDHADLELLTYVFGRIIADRETTFKHIASVIREKYGYSDSWTRKHLRLLVKRGVVAVAKNERPNKFRLKKSMPSA